jgi:DDE superfamily endonuclease
MAKGKLELHEFEYTRQGTQTLIANFEDATGKVISPTLGDTRTEDDFVAHIQATVATDPDAQWVFIADQLNTHKSTSLVKCIAELCGITTALGEKGKSGILETMASRAAFLQCTEHRIRFVYTPKHCSWLNQVEIWFGILSRRLLKRGSFASTEALSQRILAFIEFFNQTLANPCLFNYLIYFRSGVLVGSFIESTRFERNPRGDQGPYWSVTWAYSREVKGGQVFVTVFQSRTCELTYGE